MSAIKLRRVKPDQIEYSEWLKGAEGNYGWRARFDLSGGGYLGISQDGGSRVLLSPSQVQALVAFVSRGAR